MEDIAVVVQLLPQVCIQEWIVTQSVDVPVLQIMKAIMENAASASRVAPCRRA